MKNCLLQMSLMLSLLTACGGNGSGSQGLKDSQLDPINVRNDEETIEVGPLIITASSERMVEIHPDLRNIEDFRSNINNHLLKFKVHNKQFHWVDISCSKDSLLNKSLDMALTLQKPEIEIPVSFDRFDKNHMTYKCTFAIEGLVKEERSFSFLRSHIVSGEQTLESLGSTVEFDALLIEEDGVWKAGSGGKVLKVNHLISNNGKIVTFTESEVSKTPEGMEGSSGANIRINANRAVGNLFVELRGKNGGAQKMIPEKNPSLLPRDPKTNGTCKQVNRARARGCEGKQGRKGLSGFRGFPGFKGGDSGELILNVKNFSFMDIDVLYFPGKGGLGGEGGQGGNGAPGGIGSNARVQSKKGVNHRHKFPDGPKGPKGDKGPQGISGEDGKNSESTVTLIENMLSFMNDWSIGKED